MTKSSKNTSVDKTHYGQAFARATELDAAEAELSVAVDSDGKAPLRKTIRERNATLKKLTAKDCELTRALSVYLEQHDEIENVADFLKWAQDHDLLGAIELPTLRAHLRAHFGFQGERGRKSKKA